MHYCFGVFMLLIILLLHINYLHILKPCSVTLHSHTFIESLLPSCLNHIRLSAKSNLLQNEFW